MQEIGLESPITGPYEATPPRARGAKCKRSPLAGNKLLRLTFAAMLLGVFLGWCVGALELEPATKSAVVNGLHTVTNLFLRMIRMIVAPLILTTMAHGIAQMDGASAVGRVGLKVLAWFLAFSTLSIFLGLWVVDLLGPGIGMNLKVAAGTSSTSTMAQSFDVWKMITEFVPTSAIDAMAQNRVLQIVVFAIFTGLAVGSLGNRVPIVKDVLGQSSAVTLRIATYVMAFAPLAVCSALAATVAERGVGTIATLGKFVAGFYFSLALLAICISTAGLLILGRRFLTLVKLIREPLLVAFSTSSSEATIPLILDATEKFGVPRRVSGFVIPLGYAFNLDGTMMYSAFAVVFIAQAYGIDMSFVDQVGVMLFLLLANKGAAGVPRGALIGIAVTLQTFDLPQAGVVLILAVDALLDMGRTTINVFGNAVATASIARLDGELGEPMRPADDPPPPPGRSIGPVASTSSIGPRTSRRHRTPGG